MAAARRIPCPTLIMSFMCPFLFVFWAKGDYDGKCPRTILFKKLLQVGGGETGKR